MWNAIHQSDRPCGGATLAEGIAVKNVGKLTLPVVRDMVSDIVLVDEAQIERAVNAFLTLQKAMAEGAGAAGLAAMLAEPHRFRGRKVGLILCGGNIDPRILASIMVRELERDDRIVSFRLTIPDRPGNSWPDRDQARRVWRQHFQRRSSPAVPRHSRQGRQARRHRGDPRRRARRGDLSGVCGRRLSAGAAKIYWGVIPAHSVTWFSVTLAPSWHCIWQHLITRVLLPRSCQRDSNGTQGAHGYAMVRGPYKPWSPLQIPPGMKMSSRNLIVSKRL